MNKQSERNCTLNAQLHYELRVILNDLKEEQATNTSENKYSAFIKKFRELVANNLEMGLESAVPNKGASRAILESLEFKRIIVDGISVAQPIVIKIAFSGLLDPYTDSSKLLGEYQNEIEADISIRQNYSILSETIEGNYTTNESGVTMPVFGVHVDHYWLEMAKTDELTANKFKQLTVLSSHPSGIDFYKFIETLKEERAYALGQNCMTSISKKDRDHIRRHPLFQNTEDFIGFIGIHPNDLSIKNYGVWKHPITNREYPIIIDYGYSNKIAKLYAKACRLQRTVIDS